jgi:hypothetical protein
VTLSDIRTEVREELVEDSAEVWTDAELNDYINDGFSLIQKAALWKEDLDNLAVAAASDNPSGDPNNVLEITRATWDNVFLPQSNEMELDGFSDEWRQHEDYTPLRWYFLNNQPTSDNIRTYPGVSTDFATDDFTFSQETGLVVRINDGADWTFDVEDGEFVDGTDSTLPDTFYFKTEVGIVIDIADSENAVGLWYATELDELVGDTDTPDYPTWTHFIPVYYALFRCYEKEGPFRDPQLAAAYLREFMVWVSKVVRVRNRQMPDRVFSLEGIKQGLAFANRLSRIEGKNKQITFI